MRACRWVQIEKLWDQARFEMKLVNPANKRKHTILVVGSGLGGGIGGGDTGRTRLQREMLLLSGFAPAGAQHRGTGRNQRGEELSRRRRQRFPLVLRHSEGRRFPVARSERVSPGADQRATSSISAWRRVFRSRANMAARWPTGAFGGAQVSRTFYARGQTGQQLLLGAYQALERQVHEGRVTMYPRTEMLDLVVIDGRARGIVTRNLVTGQIESHVGDAVVLGTGGYGNVYYLSTNAKGSNCTAIWRAHKRGALFANPCFTQIHPTCIPVSGDYQSKLTLMSESLRNDGRIWVPMKADDKRAPKQIPENERDYYLERRYPSFGNLVPRDVASRNAKAVCDEGRGVGETGLGVYLDFADCIQRLGVDVIRERYGNLFEMYQRITDEDPYQAPMRIYPAIHYTMGGLWVDYYLMSTIPGLFVIGEANFSDHGANRLGASALMQGLSDGYFILPYTVGDYIAKTKLEKSRHGRRGVSQRGSGRGGADEKAARDSRTSDRGRVPSAIGEDRLGLLRNVAHGRGIGGGDRRNSRAARAILAGCECSGKRGRFESIAGEGRARGGFLRTGGADVHRRAAS